MRTIVGGTNRRAVYGGAHACAIDECAVLLGKGCAAAPGGLIMDVLDSGDSLAADIAYLRARADIEALIHRYALCVRSGRGAEAGPLFAKDGFFEVHSLPPAGGGKAASRRYEGREAVTAFLDTKGSDDLKVYPSISNLLVEVDGNRATATCLMRGLTVPAGTELMGEYLDTFAYDGAWRFASRTYWLRWMRQP